MFKQIINEDYIKNDSLKRPVRSFVLRQGRTTDAQVRSYHNLSPLYCLPFSQKELDFTKAFPIERKNAAKILEIGCGMGDATIAIAKANQANDYLGVEVHTPGIGRMCMEIAAHGLTNLKLIQHDAVEVLQKMIPTASLDGVHIFFPDPWPKKRHHKRRLLNPQFINLLHLVLKQGGYVHCATDWEDYSIQIQSVFNSFTGGFNSYQINADKLRAARGQTKFEERGIKLGHKIWDLYYIAK